MLRRGVLSVAAYAQAQRACAATTAKTAAGARAWLSGTAGGNEDPTPAKTKLTFASSVYGKDPQAAAPLSEEEAVEVEALRVKAQGVGAGAGAAAAAPIHDARNMFDSSLSQQAEDGKASGAIKRDVSADTPDETRVAFGATAYGKDPQAAAEVPAEVEELRMKAPGSGAGAGAAAAAAPIHDSRSLFDSDLAQGAGNAESSESISRDVKADTPEATRLVFGGSDYGKDQRSITRSEEKQAEIEELAARVGAGTVASDAAPIHHDRSMFDSDLTQSAGNAESSESINRDVKADTPEATRLVFGGSDYGKDQRSITRSEEKQAEIEELAARVGAGTVASDAAPIHHDRSMFDSELTEGAGAAPEFKAINRRVKPATPPQTRLSFFGSTYGDDNPGANHAEHAKLLAEEQKKGSKLARVGRGVRGAKVHNTKKAMADDEYSQAGSE